MSGFALDDQKKLYRTLGTRRMLSFDPRTEVVARQRFNRPIQDSHCRISTLADFAADWPEIFVEEGYEEAGNFILWVRGGDIDEIGREARLFQQMVGALPENGLARISLTINYDQWVGPAFEGSRRLTVTERRAYSATRLSDYLADFLQAGDADEALDEDRLCGLLAKAFGTAGGGSVSASAGLTFEPLSVVRYGTDPVVLTLSGMVVSTEKRAELRAHLEEGGWPFASDAWTDVTSLRFPDLTMKERIELEAAGGNPHAALTQLGFELDGVTQIPSLFDSFVRYHRFLPVTVAAEL
jgi:hypothetical protein